MNVFILLEIMFLVVILFIGLDVYLHKDDILGIRIMCCVFAVLFFKYLDLR